MVNIWQELEKPIFILAPMADVTDFPFRQIIAKYGKPDLFFTEFVSVNALCSNNALERLKLDLHFDSNQKPIIAQIFGSQPKNFFQSAQLIKKLNFDGIDINMGCPQKIILKQNAGAELMNHRELAAEIIQETKNGVVDLPVSVKTRIGYKAIDLSWLKFLLEQNLSALTVHLRTQKEMSDFPSHFEEIEAIKKLRDKIAPKTILIINGDISNIEMAKEKIDKYQVDGVMIGRGIYGQPWLFNKKIKLEQKTIEEKIKISLEHAKFFEDFFGPTDFNLNNFGKRAKSFNVLKKHFKGYVNGFKNSKNLRIKMMAANSLDELREIVKVYFS